MNAGRKRVALVTAAALLAALVVLVAGAEGDVVWETVRWGHDRLAGHVEQNPALTLVCYALIYAAVTGACLPLALALTLAGGALFGPLWGGAVATLGTTAGGTLTYLAMRTGFGDGRLRNAVARPRLEAFIDDARRRPFTLVLAARLMPFFPFAPVNIAAGLAAIPIRPYVAATFIGAVPTSLAYSAIGSGLGQALQATDSEPAIVLSPMIAWPLALLSATSLAAFLLQGGRTKRAA